MTDLRAAVLRAAKAADPRSSLQQLSGRHDAHAVLRTLASVQDGQFAASQAAALGQTTSAIKWLSSRGETESLRRGVWRFRTAIGAPDSAITAWLLCWPEATISHASAAHHHGLRGMAGTGLPEVTVPNGVTRRPSEVIVRYSRFLPRADRLFVGGVAYTSLARTVCDLAHSDDPWGTLSRVDDAVAMGASPRWIHECAKALVNGRNGVVLVRDATVTGAAAVFRSWLERASAHVYRAAHLPEPEWNVPVHDDRGRIGIVDALWREWRVVSEKEGLRFHTTPAQRRRDAERFNRLLDASYAARRFSWHDIVERPTYVAATIARALVAAGAAVDLARIPDNITIPRLAFSA